MDFLFIFDIKSKSLFLSRDRFGEKPIFYYKTDYGFYFASDVSFISSLAEKKFSINANKGWLGITDKYWITSLIPQENRKFRTDFDYKNKFRANFIETSATEIGANETKSNEIKIIIAAITS